MVVGAGVDGWVVDRAIVARVAIAEPVDHHEIENLRFPILPAELARIVTGMPSNRGMRTSALGAPSPVAHSRRLVRPAP